MYMIVQCSPAYMGIRSVWNESRIYMYRYIEKCIQFSVEIVLVFSLAFVFFPPARVPFVKIRLRETEKKQSVA